MPNSSTNTLNRWLDRNPKGPLTRTRGLITVPAFTVSTEWLGYGDIVGIIDYVSPRNFTIKDYSQLPVGGDYSMMVSYVNADRTVKRWRLVAGDQENIFVDIPQYDGEIIKKLFRLEIWSTPALIASQIGSVVLRTSILNDIDYRYGADTELDTSETISTNFGSLLGNAVISAIPSQVGLVLWFDTSGIQTSITPPPPGTSEIIGEGGEHIVGEGAGEHIAGED